MSIKNFFEKLDLNSRERHLKNLVAIARIDGHLHQDEVQFLYNIGEKYEFSKEEVDGMLDEDDIEQAEIPTLPSHRVGQLFDLVIMMMADNVIDQKELELCRHMCRRYGYHPTLITRLIEFYKENEAHASDAEWETIIGEAEALSLG